MAMTNSIINKALEPIVLIGKGVARFRNHAKHNRLNAQYQAAIKADIAASKAWADLARTYSQVAEPKWSVFVLCLQKSGLAQYEMRTISGASPSAISRWSSGDSEPAPALRERLVREFLDGAEAHQVAIGEQAGLAE